MFKFNLGDRVRIIESGESGTIQQRADALDCANQYQVAYRGADGVARIDWFFESRLIPFVAGLRGPDPMAGVEVKAADVSRRTLAMVGSAAVETEPAPFTDGSLPPQMLGPILKAAADLERAISTGGGGGVDETRPADATGGGGGGIEGQV